MISTTTPPSPRRTLSGLARRAASLVALVSLSMCNLDHVDFDAGGKVTIPKATLLSTLLGNLAIPGFDSLDFSQQFQNQGVSKGDVNSVKLKSFTLDVEAPADGNFDFLQSITFFAEASGSPKIQIATMSPVPKGKKELTLVVDPSAELAPYVVAPSMSITSQVTGSAPDADTTVNAAVVLDVEVHIPGCN